VVFLSTDTDTPSLTRVNADGSHPKTLATGSIWKPSCAADGTGIYYLTTNTPQKVWRVPLESGNAVEIAAIEENSAGSVAVSPDGKLLAYTYTQFGRVPSDGWHIAIVTLPGGARRQVIDVAGISNLHWSSDGRRLEYLMAIGGATNIWTLSLDGGKARQLTQFNPGDLYDFSWAADGSRLFMVRGRTKSDVALIKGLE
jgi:Tol biopolymer transport system component